MSLLKRNLITFFFLLLFFYLLPSSIFADTTPFRSAQIITTDGAVPYTNLGNCNATDGLTCDRASAPQYANLYFRDFGNLEDFNMPPGSTITRVRVRVTGIASHNIFVTSSPGSRFRVNCERTPDLFKTNQLHGDIIKTQNFSAPLSTVYQLGTINAGCYSPSIIESGNFIWRINFSYINNWSAKIDNLEIAFDFTPPPPQTAKPPVIFIPGIGGSELKVMETTPWAHLDGHGGTFANTYQMNELVWVNTVEALKPGSDDYFDVLRMQYDGINSDANLGLTGNLVSSAYASTTEFFTSQGYTLGTDFFISPYDWRKDIKTTTSLLDQKIQAVKEITGAQKINIVAHSMGGLVAREYISDSQRAQNVDKLFTLGTPHLGAVKSVKAIIFGDCLTDSRLTSLPVCIGLTNSELRDVMQNMISNYELTPSQYYYTFYPGDNASRPYPFADMRDMDANGITGPLNYIQIKELLTNLDHNTSLFTPSENFHQLDSTYPVTNGVNVTNIVGSGVPTLGQIIEKESINFFGVKTTKKDEAMINGDGTVPLFSASLIDEGRSISLLGSAGVYYTKQNHGGLPGTGPALQLVSSLLTGNTELPPGVTSQPSSFNGKIISVHSPVDIHVYDVFNNHTGPITDGYEENIPGSIYETLGDAKFIYLPEDGQYQIFFEATDQGSFDFQIKEYTDSENTETALYKDIPLTIQTKAETILDTGSTTTPVLHVDENGDNVEDFQVERFSILEGDENSDLVPPLLSFQISHTSIWPPNNKMVDIQVVGSVSDDNPYLTKIIVEDEYDMVEPSITLGNQTNISQILRLQASRREDDLDGRKYTVRVYASDVAGNISLSTFYADVPHDQKINH